MAVSIPRINRIEPSTTMPKNDRLNLQVRDQAYNIQQATKTAVAFGNVAGDIYQEYENDKIDQLSSEADLEYTRWNDEKLTQLKNYDGDPTDAYVKYDEESKEKYEEIINRRPDLNDRVKRHFTSRLAKTVENQNTAVLKQRGLQQEVYKNNLFEATVRLKKNSLPVSASYAQKDDPTSFAMFDQGMSDIKTLVAKQGIDKGTVLKLPSDAKSWTHAYQDDEGNMVKVNMTDIAKQRVAKELSEGVQYSLESMIAAGQVEEAKIMKDRYKAYLDPKALTSVEKKFKDKGVKDDANNFLNNLRGKSSDVQLAEIEKIQDFELKSEVLKKKEAYDNLIESQRDRKVKVNYNTLSSHVLEKMNSPQPYNGVADLEADPKFSQTWDNLDTKGKKAIMEMVKAPKESNEKALIKTHQLILGESGDIQTMTVQDFYNETAGLSKADRNKALTQFMKLKDPSASQERASVKRANEYLRDQFLIDEHIKRDKFGKIRGDDETTLLKAQQKLLDYLDNNTGLNEKQLKDFVKDFSAAEIKGKVFTPEIKVIEMKKPMSVKTEANLIQDMKTSPTRLKQLNELKRQFRAENKYFPTDNDEQFLNYVKRKVK